MVCSRGSKSTAMGLYSSADMGTEMLLRVSGSTRKMFPVTEELLLVMRRKESW